MDYSVDEYGEMNIAYLVDESQGIIFCVINNSTLP